MKEHIYTIPLSEAVEQGGECLFCTLEKRLEAEAVDYALGASMMEPDSRVVSNEKGFCRRHYAQMAEKNNALSLALVLDTHLNEVRERLAKTKDAATAGKGGLFKKNAGLADAAVKVREMTDSCVICEKLEKTLARYADTFWHLYTTEPDFREKVRSGKGFCLPHFALLLAACEREVPGGKQAACIEELYALEEAQLARLNEEVNWFTKKFDYRFHDAPWGDAKDAPARTMEKVAKFL